MSANHRGLGFGALAVLGLWGASGRRRARR
jgi:hypothetical protein